MGAFNNEREKRAHNNIIIAFNNERERETRQP